MTRTLSLVAVMLLVLSADNARAQSADGIKGVDGATSFHHEPFQ